MWHGVVWPDGIGVHHVSTKSMGRACVGVRCCVVQSGCWLHGDSFHGTIQAQRSTRLLTKDSFDRPVWQVLPEALPALRNEHATRLEVAFRALFGSLERLDLLHFGYVGARLLVICHGVLFFLLLAGSQTFVSTRSSQRYCCRLTWYILNNLFE